ncbi:MAG TPA: helix-turn-helix transcriptional regulator [Trebonia sp.]|nr:helix-turn-helix transcriptional regulator [Trebonia sp.]
MRSHGSESDPRVLLGELLRLARDVDGRKTQQDVAAIIGLERSTVAKGETGRQVPNARVLSAWLDGLGVSGLARSAIEGVHRLARLMERDPGDARVAPFYETEARAHTVRYWAPIIMPGIVQTPAYATALFAAMRFDAARVAEKLEVRMARQAILERADPPDITIVVWEAVLRHQIGTAGTMREQIARLLALSDMPTVTIHVLPSSHGANPGLGGAIQLAATDDAPELLLSDSLVEDQLSNDPVLVRRASSTFNSVRADALNRGGSRDALMEAMEIWSE